MHLLFDQIELPAANRQLFTEHVSSTAIMIAHGLGI